MTSGGYENIIVILSCVNIRFSFRLQLVRFHAFCQVFFFIDVLCRTHTPGDQKVARQQVVRKLRSWWFKRALQMPSHCFDWGLHKAISNRHKSMKLFQGCPPLLGGFVFLLSTQSTLNYSAAVFFCINRTHGNNPVILSCHLSLGPTVNPISAFTCSSHASQCLSISFSRVLPPVHRWQHLMLYQSQRTPPTLTGNT